MKTNYLILLIVSLVIISCSKDGSMDEKPINNSIPEIVDLVSFIPDTSFDTTPNGKYVGVLGHNEDPDLHGKIYVNAGLDGRYKAQVILVDGKQMNFAGKVNSTDSNKIHFESSHGNFDVDFNNYNSPEATNVFIINKSTEAYITLAKSAAGADPLIRMGSYVDSNDPTFFGNWDLIGDPITLVSTPFMTTLPDIPFPVSGNALSQEIVTLSISHLGSTTAIVIDSPDDFDINAAVACAPSGIDIPSTEPVLLVINVTAPIFLGEVGTAVSAGGQTSTILGQNTGWSYNYNSEIINPFGVNPPESYTNNDCSPATSGTWSFNGRSGTTTAL